MYRSMQGKEIDMNKLSQQNELVHAVGNAKVNARGDELGANGQIIRKREEVLASAMSGNIIPNEMADQQNILPTIEEEVVGEDEEL